MGSIFSILIATPDGQLRSLIEDSLRDSVDGQIDRSPVSLQISVATTVSGMEQDLEQETFDGIFLDSDLLLHGDAEELNLLTTCTEGSHLSAPLILLSTPEQPPQIPDPIRRQAWESYPKAELTPRVIALLVRQLLRSQIADQQMAQQLGQIRTQYRQLESQELQLLQASQIRSQFLATTSHELRTPLNAIIGFAQILLYQSKGPLTQQQHTMVQRILKNGHHLLTLLNDILDLSQIEAGRLQLVPESFDLRELLTTTLEELRPLADQKALQLSLICESEALPVVLDRGRLRQILTHLLANGIKYTEQGRVWVTLQEQQAEQILIQVQDTGIGIHPTQLPLIFEAFRQLDQTDKRRRMGAGIGLTIVHSLVQMMQGQIRVDSTPGQGTSFWIELPRTAVGSQASARSSSTQG